MKKVYFFVIASAFAADAITSARSANISRESALESYDIHNDQESAGAGTVPNYRQQAGGGLADKLAAPRQLLVTHLAAPRENPK